MFGFEAKMMGQKYQVRLTFLLSSPLSTSSSPRRLTRRPFPPRPFFAAHARRDQARSRLPQDLLDLDGRRENEDASFPDGSEPRNEQHDPVLGGVQGESRLDFLFLLSRRSFLFLFNNNRTDSSFLSFSRRSLEERR